MMTQTFYSSSLVFFFFFFFSLICAPQCSSVTFIRWDITLVNYHSYNRKIIFVIASRLSLFFSSLSRSFSFMLSAIKHFYNCTLIYIRDIKRCYCKFNKLHSTLTHMQVWWWRWARWICTRLSRHEKKEACEWCLPVFLAHFHAQLHDCHQSERVNA